MNSINLGMFSDKRKLGNVGEEVACDFLTRKGFRIIERNYLRAYGEIDVIAEFKGVVRFIEVKTISREKSEGISREMSHYRPEDQIHPAKIRKVIRTAQAYMAHKKDTREYQIDAVTVVLEISSKTAYCKLFEQIL